MSEKLDLNKISRKILIILSLVLILGIFLSIPMFAETQDELKQVFVTREEWDKWLNVNGYSDATSVVGMSKYLESIEIINQVKLQEMVKAEFIKRGLKIPIEESSSVAP